MKRAEMRCVGTLAGCRVWIELASAHDEERDAHFEQVRAIFLGAIEQISPFSRDLREAHERQQAEDEAT